MKKDFQGVFTAIVTPFTQDNTIDWNAFERLIESQVSGGVQGIVFVGTTGESPTLSHKEHKEILQWSAGVVNGRCQVIHGTGSNATAECIDFAKFSADCGADAQLVITPYYNKPTQDGIKAHFLAIANTTNLPIILYNIAGRTMVNIEISTLLELAQHKNIIGVKEASGNLGQMMDVISQTPDDFVVLCGDDSLTLSFMAVGGDGVISVLSNALPREMNEYMQANFDGDFQKSRELFYSLYPLMQDCFLETNPIPIKHIMAELGYGADVLRLPMTPLSKNNREKIAKTLAKIKSLA